MDHQTNLFKSCSLQNIHEKSSEHELKRINRFERMSFHNFDKFGSCEHLPPPQHCSTPKSKFTEIKQGHIQKPIADRKPFDENSSTATWLEELRTNFSPECMTTLQSKSLFVNVCSKIKMLTKLTIKVIGILHNQTYLIAKEFDHIYRRLECNCVNGVYELIENLVDHMLHVLTQNSNFQEFDQYYEVLQLIAPESQGHQISLPDLVWKINALALDFSKKIDILLLNQIKILVGVIDSKQSNESLLVLLKGINEVGLQADHLGNLLSRCGGITTLVKLIEPSVSNAVQMAVLRILAKVCCSPSAIKSFKDADGLEVLCEMLAANYTEGNKLKEGVLLILQITGPWLQYKIIPLEKYIVKLVSSLTGVVKKTFNSETLLVSSAALANLSHEEISFQSFVEYGTIGAILTAIRSQGADANVFLKEQAATIILNMAEKPEFRCFLCENRVIPAILCFLKSQLSTQSSLAEAATYRVQHKSALALARLCNEEEAIRQVQELQGVSRLIKLCKEGIERNQEDGVATASLEALRKIMATGNNIQFSLGKKFMPYSKQSVSTH